MTLNRGVFIVICALLPLAGSLPAGAHSQNLRLEPAQPVARDLAVGETHSLAIALAADEWLSLRIEQRGVDVTATLVGPDDLTRTSVDDAKGRQGAETVAIVADAPGDYRLDIRASDRNAAGGYEVTIIARRPPTADERALDGARRLFDDAQRLRQQGRYNDALAPAERALAVREQILGAEDLAVADALSLVAVIFDDRHDYARAEAPNLRALAIRERLLGGDHPAVASSLFNLAWLAKVAQDFAKADALYHRALDIQERALGPDHAEVATTLNDLGLLYGEMGRYPESIAVSERVLAIREKVQGPEAEGVGRALNNLADACLNTGDYARAESLLRRALTIWEKASGPDHPDVAFALDGLGKLFYDNGDYAAAEPLLLRSIAIREKALGPSHGELTTSLDILAALYRQKGDYEKAERIILRDLAITEKTLGPDHAYFALSLVNLATTYELNGEYERAAPLYRRALTIQETALGPNHRAVGVTLNRLGRLVLDSGGDPAQAEAFFQRALTTLEAAVGLEHPSIAPTFSGLAALGERRGDGAQAEQQYQRAMAVQEKVFGPAHPAVAASLERLAALAQSRGDVPRAMALLSRALEIRGQQLDHNLVAGSERQKLAYVGVFAEDVDRAVSLHASLAPHDPEALGLALTTVLRRKGLAVDATSDNIATLRANASPDDRALFDRLATMRSQLASVTLRGTTGSSGLYRAQLARLRDEVDTLEADLATRSAAFRAQSRPVTLEAVRAAVPDGAVLVEFVAYRRDDDAGRPTASRYAAYVLAHQGAARWIDLGEAEVIDQAVSSWRRALGDPERSDARRLGRALDARIMQPVRDLVDDAAHLLISPDGQLNLIPFAALVDEQNRYLVERYTISYLTSGRDLLRLHVRQDSRSDPVIVAAPDFGEPAVVAGRSAGEPARIDESRLFFGPLPGAAGEVRALTGLLPGATVLTGPRATEAALRRVHGPRILHLATHGFFLERDPASRVTASASGPRSGTGIAATDNPLVRSGLALAGANQGRSGVDDGVLTALEAAGLDLWGTELVVLSACDTGVGEVRNGDGVYGLRRALVLAGSDSQLMSLWPVPDRSTRDLMIAYYTLVAGSAGRADALRQAQLRLLRSGARRQPYYWAGFIQSGEWGTLGGRP